MNLNKVFVLGRLTRDPQSKNLPSGQSVASFGLATDRFFTDKNGQKQQQAEFHNIVLFGKLAEIASQYLSKGSLVLIEGRLQTRTWQDPTGIKKYRTEIVAQSLQLGPKTTNKTASIIPSSKKQGPIQQEEIPVIEESDVYSPPMTPMGEARKNENYFDLASTQAIEEDEEEIDVSKIPL